MRTAMITRKNLLGSGQQAQRDHSAVRRPNLPLASVGNQAMQRLLKQGTLQKKLKINQPGDAFEQEADRVADKVMRMADPASQPLTPPARSSTILQRCSCGSGNNGEECEGRKAQAMKVQRASVVETAGTAPPIIHDVLKSPGRPLDPATQNFMEPRFGHDFGGVRLHTDAKAAESARTVDALAYTVGNHITFDAGQYAPGTQSGRRLLAHELAHVVQQDISATQHNRLQRTPDDKKTAAATESDCEPSPATFEEIRKIDKDDPTSVGFTQKNKIEFDWRPEFKGGNCTVKVAKVPKLTFKHFVFTKEGSYVFGPAIDKSGTCKGKHMDHIIVITPAMAERIKEGEIEHCQDYQLAFDLSYARYNKACDDLGTGFPAKNAKDCRNQVFDRLDKAVGIDPAQWATVANCLFDKTLQRDDKKKGWHTLDLGPGRFDKDCKHFTTTPNSRTALPEIGKHPSKDLIKGCGE
jgi:hypothetical protein